MATRFEVHASAAETTSFQTDAFGSNFRNMQFSLEVTVVTGSTPTLDINIQHSANGSDWHTVGTFTQATAATFEFVSQTADGDLWRLDYVIGGSTPSFTFVMRVMLYD